MTWLILILGVVLFIAIKFFTDWKRQNVKILKEGGVLKKYNTLITKLQGNTTPTIFISDAERYSFGWITLNVDNRFSIIESFGNVLVKWTFKANIPISENINLSKQWKLDENCNQEYEANKILADIESQTKNMFSLNFETDIVLSEKQKEETKNLDNNPNIADDGMLINFYTIEQNFEVGTFSNNDIFKIIENRLEQNNIDIESTISLLKKYPKVIQLKKDNGDYLLHHACTKQVEPIIKYLLLNGGDIEAKGNYGETPIFRCITFNNESVCYNLCKLLIKFGAKVNVANSYPETLLGFVTNAGYDENCNLFELLQKKSIFEKNYNLEKQNFSTTDDIKAKFKMIVANLSWGLNDKSFETLLTDFIITEGKEKAKKTFHYLVEGWEQNKFQKESYDTIFYKTFYQI